MDACGSPECRFLSGAQHTTETPLERVWPFTAFVVKKKFVNTNDEVCSEKYNGKIQVTYQSLYKCIT